MESRYRTVCNKTAQALLNRPECGRGRRARLWRRWQAPGAKREPDLIGAYATFANACFYPVLRRFLHDFASLGLPRQKCPRRWLGFPSRFRLPPPEPELMALGLEPSKKKERSKVEHILKFSNSAYAHIFAAGNRTLGKVQID
jgi:hypothetical protein